MSNTDLDKFLGECPTHKKLPWKIGAIESGQVAIDSDDGKEVTGWIDPEDAYLILNQQQRIEELERANQHLVMALADAEALEIGTAERCDALQADNARLREALCYIHDIRDPLMASRRLQETLAAALAACKMKDETLQELDQLIPVGATIAALAIQPDDAALKAWLGEPVAYMNPYGGIVTKPSTGLEQTTYTIPLYSPKGLK